MSSPLSPIPSCLTHSTIKNVSKKQQQPFLRLNKERANVRYYLRVRNLSITLDPVTSSASYCLKRIARVRRTMSKKDLERLSPILISTCLDYSNSLFTNFSKKDLQQLQSFHKAAACLFPETKKNNFITLTLKPLHRPPMALRTVYKPLRGSGPGTSRACSSI